MPTLSEKVNGLLFSSLVEVFMKFCLANRSGVVRTGAVVVGGIALATVMTACGGGDSEPAPVSGTPTSVVVSSTVAVTSPVTPAATVPETPAPDPQPALSEPPAQQVPAQPEAPTKPAQTQAPAPTKPAPTLADPGFEPRAGY